MITNRRFCVLHAICCGIFTPAILAQTLVRAEPAIPPSNDTTQITVVDALGLPLPNAGIYAENFTMTRGASPVGTTDSQGHISMPSWPRSVIIVSNRGSVTFAKAKEDVVQIAPGTTFKLHIVNELGKPYVGMRVTVFPTVDTHPLSAVAIGGDTPSLPDDLQPRMSGLTDKDGIVTLHDLPQGERISITVRPRSSRYSFALAGSIALDKSAVSKPQTIRLAFNGSITGRVYDGQSHKPVSGAAASLDGPGYHNWMGTALTDQNGWYHFSGLCPARYGIMMRDPKALQQISVSTGEYRYASMPVVKGEKWVSPDSVPQVAVSDGGKASGPDFMLVKTGVISGQVFGADGRPVFGSQVMATMQDGSGWGIYTGIDGRFRYRMAPGTVRLSWSAQGDSAPSPPAKTVKLAAGETRIVNLGPRPKSMTRAAAERTIAPDFSVQTSDGKTIKLSDFRGKVVVLDFWFTGDNRDMLPPLSHTNAVLRRMASRKVVGLAVDTGIDESSKAFDEVVAGHPELSSITFARDTSDWHRDGQRKSCTLYRVDGWPLRFVIGPDGTIRNRITGESVKDEALLAKEIELALH